MRYILRFCVQPGFGQEEKLHELVRYAKRAKLDEVMFFMNCEEIFAGHLPFSEYEPWLDMIIKAAKSLEKIGCGWSLNPWTTILHTDRGRVKPADLDYQLMVDPSGTSSTCVACPGDPTFTKYISDLYGRFATYSPAVLWVEDDFRLHNHAPLKWGGCFCESCMAKFSEKLGKPVSREDFVKNLCATEGPNPYRDAWLSVARETMLNLAHAIGDAVRAANPKVPLGLMSSVPAVHAAEYRDWHGIFSEFGTDTPAHSRPHLPAYGDRHPIDYLYSFATISARTVASIPDNAPVYPELENALWSSYSKSDAMAALQIELSMALGASGITMNIFEMNGNGVDPAEDFDIYLRRRKPYLAAATKIGFSLKSHIGFKALFHPDSSKTINIEPSDTPAALYPREDTFAGLLSVLGISTMPLEAKTLPSGQMVAICGQILRNYTPAQIKALFRDNKVMLDGESVMVLCDLGLQKLIGVKDAHVVPADTGLPYEQISVGERYGGFDRGRISMGDDFVSITYDAPVRTLSHAHTYLGAAAAPAMTRHGNVFILPYVFRKYVPTFQFSHVRQAVLAEFAHDMGAPLVKGGTGVAIHAYEQGFLLTNATADDARGLTVCWLGKASAEVFEVLPSGEHSDPLALNERGELAIKGTLKRLSTRTFAFV